MIFHLGLASVPKDNILFRLSVLALSRTIITTHYHHTLKVFLLSTEQSSMQIKRPRLPSLSQSFECQSPATNTYLQFSSRDSYNDV